MNHNYVKYKLKYMKYKQKYIELKNKQFIQKGGADAQRSNQISIVTNKIDELIQDEFKNLKVITKDDLSGLQLRIYEGHQKNNIEYFIFIPPKILAYLNNNDILGDYYEDKYNSIYATPLKDIFFDFQTKKNKIKICFRDNYTNGQPAYFEVNLPIKFIDLIEKLFEHFDKVGLVGYPDNGGIDGIEYNKDLDIYFVLTWS